MTFLAVYHSAKKVKRLLEVMVSLSVTYSVATAASLCIAAFASLLMTYSFNLGWLGKIFLIPLVAYAIGVVLSLVLQALTCKDVMIGSTFQGNLFFLLLIPIMWLLYSPSDAQTLPYVQRIVTSVLDSSWTNEQKSPFAYAYWTFFTCLIFFAFLLPVQTACAK
jgi:hypothetical protein